jgi:predicted regulator of Ras-like GTPase activity (Roadblock/LC7/MglB family)
VGLTVPFRTILSNIVENTPGVIAAAFLDHEGESIEVSASGISREQARVFGAYAGIFLSRAARIGQTVMSDATRRIRIDWDAGVSVLAEPLQDGYYIVLVVRRPFPEARAVRELETARNALQKEL